MPAPEPSESSESAAPAVPQQVYYHYHIPFGGEAWAALYIFFGLTAVIMRFQYDYHGYILWFLTNTSNNLGILLDPDRSSLSKKKKLPDGSEVKVNKPLIGLRACEEQTTEFPGAPGRTLPNKWKYERAYLRI